MPIHSSAPTSDTTQVQLDGFRASRLSASLTVTDLQASLTWYRDIVGFAVHQEYAREGRLLAVAVHAGAVQILLNQDNGARGVDRIKGEGFSLRITTTENVDELAERIKARGGTLESEPADVWGQRAFRLRDPDGFKLAISSER